MMRRKRDNSVEATIAAVLAWLLPGAGHWWLGNRGLASVLFLTISFVYGVGLATGGIKNSVNPYTSMPLFLGELGAGGYTLAAFGVNETILSDLPSRVVPELVGMNPLAFGRRSFEEQERLRKKAVEYISFYPESDVSQIYLATAGLLNILAIIDAIARAQSGKATYPAPAPIDTPSLSAEARPAAETAGAAS